MWQSLVFVTAMVIGMLLCDRRDALIPASIEHESRPVAPGAAAR
jgi:hypothetical protein